MAQRSRVLLILAGFVAGVGGTLLFTGGLLPPVQAQKPGPTTIQGAAKPKEAGRYQISAWSVGGLTPPGKLQVSHGAYVIDSQTGEVFSVNTIEKPKSVGSVVEKD